MYPGIVRCNDCGYVYADLELSQHEFEVLYNSGYFKGEEYSDYLADKSIHQRNFSDRLDLLLDYVNLNQHRSLLEVGSAYGFFLELAAQKFEYVAGVDVTESGVVYSQETLNLNTNKIDLLDWDFTGRKFDVTCLWDTIEHLRRPDLYLEKISANMSSGGLLAVTTGDVKSVVAKIRKSRWRLIHPPTHAHYFSRESLTSLMARYGFEVVHFEHCGYFRSVDNIAYNLFALRSHLSWFYNMLKSLRMTSWNIYTNLYDIMYIVARKR